MPYPFPLEFIFRHFLIAATNSAGRRPGDLCLLGIMFQEPHKGQKI